MINDIKFLVVRYDKSFFIVMGFSVYVGCFFFMLWFRFLGYLFGFCGIFILIRVFIIIIVGEERNGEAVLVIRSFSLERDMCYFCLFFIS